MSCLLTGKSTAGGDGTVGPVFAREGGHSSVGAVGTIKSKGIRKNAEKGEGPHGKEKGKKKQEKGEVEEKWRRE